LASIINSTDTGSGGLITTGDSSDELQIQTAETTAITITSGQQSVFIAGTAAAPAVTTTGDLNTGIFFSAADTLVVTTGGTAAVTVDSGQRTKFPTTIGVGGATPSASGSGISFPATQSASSDANTLDDYEEGTWTPLYEPETGAFGSITMQTGGVYTKIGDTVFVNCQMLVSSLTIGSASGSVRISGFPFAAQASTGSANQFAVTQTEQWNTQNGAFSIGGNATAGNLLKRTAADGAISTLNVNQMGTGVSNYVLCWKLQSSLIICLGRCRRTFKEIQMAITKTSSSRPNHSNRERNHFVSGSN
jgi:hypothetical protein